MKKMFFFLLVFLLFPPSIFSFSPDEEDNSWKSAILRNTEDPWELAYYMTAEMSDEHALAQTFMLAWIGVEPSPLIMNWIRERNVGGVKIFGWNTEDTRRLAETIGEFQRNSQNSGFGIPLFVATDQEGGIVRHVKGSTSDTPGNMAIGASGRPIDAYWAGYYIGREMSVLGINMNFAPTVDIFNNRYSSLIGTRSFGADPAMAGILGAAFAKGHRDAGIMATAKHFPGHGDTHLDSHGVLPRIGISLETLWERELVPYRFLIREKIPAVMSAHLAFPDTPGGAIPASLSSWFLNDLLREELGFDGLVITDDLMMGGALNYTGSLSRAAKQAIEAGNDVIMLSQTPNLNDAIWTFLLSSMRTEPAFRERVRDACRRVLALKLEYFRGENTAPLVPDLAEVDAGLPHPEGGSFFLSLAARSVTVIDNANVFPLNPENAGRVLLAGNSSEFFNTGRRAFPDASSYWYPSSQTLGDIGLYARNADTVILRVSGRLGTSAIEQLRRLNTRLIVFSVLNPGFLDDISHADGKVIVYSSARESYIAGFSAILGRIPAGGRLPFAIRDNRLVSPRD